MKKRYLIIGILSILVMMIGISYAYFTGIIVGEGSPITVKAKKLAIVFTDTEEIGGSLINPGWNVSKTFTVENKSGGVFYYDINIDDLVNTFVTTGYLKYKITSNDGGYNMSDFIDISKSNEARREKLAGNIEIENGKIHTYKIEFIYENSDEDQSADMGKELSGSLSITESEIIVVKYKVNNVIQDTIPDNTEPYIVNTVTCSNNAEGTWNEESETVELTNNVKQTVCIVEFKEGHSVNIIAENNEVVSPINKVVGRIGSATFTIEKREGYEIDNARVTCDNGALGSIEGNTITITNVTKDNTCRVVTNPKIIIVTYNANGGSGVSPATDTVTYASKYKLPVTNPTRTGYTFVGWFTEASGGTEVTTNTDVTNANDHSIYAHWTINSYNATLKVVNGTPTSETKSVNYNGSTTFTIKANSGYKLDGATYSCTGWSYDQNGTVTVSGVTGTTSCTITLAQSKVTFTMKTNLNADTVNNNTSACYVIRHILDEDDKTATDATGNKYSNCTIVSSSMARSDNSSIVWTDMSNLFWRGSYGMWCNRYQGGYYYVACTVTLTCDPT